VQLVLPSGEKLPLAQVKQAAALVCDASPLYVPAGQAVQDTPFGVHTLLSLPQMQTGQDRVLLQVAVLALAL
jgi:hypothetical protein